MYKYHLCANLSNYLIRNCRAPVGLLTVFKLRFSNWQPDLSRWLPLLSGLSNFIWFLLLQSALLFAKVNSRSCYFYTLPAFQPTLHLLMTILLSMRPSSVQCEHSPQTAVFPSGFSPRSNIWFWILVLHKPVFYGVTIYIRNFTRRADFTISASDSQSVGVGEIKIPTSNTWFEYGETVNTRIYWSNLLVIFHEWAINIPIVLTNAFRP